MSHTQLLEWQENERTNAAKALSQAFLDPETWGGNWTSEHQSLAEQTLDPEATKKAIANRDWIATQEGKNPDDIAPFLPAYRKAYAQKVFRKPDMGDSELYGAIQAKYQGEEARANIQYKVIGAVALQLFDEYNPAIKAPVANAVELGNKFVALNPDILKGLDAEGQGNVKTDVQNMLPKMRAAFEEDAPTVGILFRAITNQTGQIKDDNAPTVNQALSALSLLAPEKRRAAYDLVTLALAAKGLDTKSEWMNAADALGRGTIGMVNQMVRVGFEERQSMMLETLKDESRPVNERIQPVGMSEGPEISPERRAEKIKEIEGNLEAIRMIREFEAQAQKADPVRSASKGITGFAQNAAYGLLGSTGYMAASMVPAIGGPLIFSAVYAAEKEDLLLRNPDMPLASASIAALQYAIPSTVLERIQWNIFKGKAPVFAETLKAMTMAKKGWMGVAAHAGGDLALRTGQETAIEVTQGWLKIAMNSINEDLPNYDSKKEYEGLKDSLPETVGTMFMMSLFGTGVATVSDIRNGGRFLEDTEVMRQAGLSDADAVAVAAEATPEAREAKLREVWQNRTPESIAAGVEEQKKAVKAAKERQESSVTPTWESTRQDDGSMMHTVKGSDGRVIVSTLDSDEAERALEEERKAFVSASATGIQEAVEFYQGVQDALGSGEGLRKVLFDGAPKSFLQLYKANPSQKNLDRLFETVRSMGDEITEPGQLANYFAAASNQGEIIEGVYQGVIKLSGMADPKIFLREMAQESLKAAMVEEGVEIQWVREQLESMRSIKGYENLITDTDTAVIESFSDVALNVFIGRTKEPQVPTGLRGFLRQVAALGREIIYQVFHLKRAIAEGRVDENWHEFLARSVGLDLDRQIAIEGEKAVRQMERDAMDDLRGGDHAQGGEILDVLKKAPGNGKLPSKTSKYWAANAGELQVLQDAVKSLGHGNYKSQKGMLISDIFSKDAIDPDKLLETFNEHGFAFFTVDDMFQALQERFSSGKPMHGYKSNDALHGEHFSVAKALLAPNGKPSNLTPKQHAEFRTTEFKRGFGDWEAIARATMRRMAKSFSEAKAQADEFVGKELTNLDTGKTATVSKANLEKMFSSSAAFKSTNAADHALAIANADQLFANALLDHSHPDKNGEPTISAIHRFVAPMINGEGRVVAVKLTVKETVSAKQPNPLYTIETIEIVKPALGAPQSGIEWVPENRNTPQAGFDGKVMAMLSSVNPDSVSKAVDENGEPLPIYHGSPDIRGIVAEGFKGFSRGEAFFGSDSFAVADTYADDKRALDYQAAEPHTIPLTVRLLNPMIVDAGGKHWRETEKHVSEAKEKGHDGLIIKNSLDEYNNRANGKLSTVFVWFKSNQAKSAIDGQLKSRVDGKPIDGATANRGTYDPADPRINYSTIRKAALDPETVQKELDSRMRNPTVRLKVYERAKAMFEAERAKRGDSIDPNRKFESLRQSMVELNAILSALPPEIRGKVGGMMTLANLGKDTVAGNRIETIDKFIVKRIGMLDKELEKALSEEYREAILKLVEKSRPKSGDNGVKRSTLGAETQAFADAVRRATLLDTDATAERMAAIKEALKTADAESASKLTEEWGILNSFGDIDSMDAETLAASHDILKTALKAGREAWAIKEQERIDRHRAAVDAWEAAIGDATDAGRWKKKGVLKLVLEKANAFDLDHKSFENFVRAITTDEIANDLGKRMRIADNAAQDMEIAHREGLMQAIRDAAKTAGMSAGKAVLHLMESQKGAVDYLSGRMVKNERLTIEQAEKVVRGEINPSKLSKADIEILRDELAAIPADSQKEYVIVKRVISEGRNIKLDMSRDQAIQVLLTWAQPDAREKLRREGWQESSITQLMKMTNDPISQAVMDHLKGYYADNAKTVNPVYAGMFGTNLPQVQNYAPTRFINKQDTRDVGPDGIPQVSGSTPGFFKGRTNHSAKLAPAGAMEVFGGHVSQTAHWVNFAELSRDFRGLVASSRVREAIKESLGDPVLNTAEAWADLLEQRGGNRAKEAAWVNPLLGAFIGGRAISSLGFNLKTILMQSDSAMRAIAAIDMRQLANALADPAGLAASMPDVWNSPTVQRRLKGGMNPEAKFIFSKFAGKPGIGAHVAMAAMTPIQFFDATATTLSSAIVFRATYKDAIESGMNETMATNAAMDAMDAAVYRFSQPTSFGSKSRVENTGGSIQKLFTLFMSDPRLKTAMIADSVRGLATGKGNKSDHIRRIVAVELMGIMSWLLAAGYRDLTSDDPDEEIYTMGGFAQAVLLAPLQGYLFAGTVASSALTYLTGKMPYQSSRDPFVDTVDRAYRAVKHIEDAANFDDPDALLKEWDNIARTISIHPDLAAPAVIINAVKPLVGIKQNLENPE